jgi:hypothetical protein
VPKNEEFTNENEWYDQAMENEGQVLSSRHLSASASHSNNFTFNGKKFGNLQ